MHAQPYHTNTKKIELMSEQHNVCLIFVKNLDIWGELLNEMPSVEYVS